MRELLIFLSGFGLMTLILYIYGRYLRKKQKAALHQALTPQQKELVKDADKYVYIQYRNTVIKMTLDEHKVFLSGNRRQRNQMVKLALKGEDFTKHFKTIGQ